MTRLRKMMLDELERRNYTQSTRRAYLLGDVLTVIQRRASKKKERLWTIDAHTGNLRRKGL